jgi:hypothetical protein
VLLMMVGLGAAIWGVTQWAERGFGDLDTSGTMRAMIVATTTLVAGTQLALTAFMSSVINIPLLEQRLSPGPDPTSPPG